MDMLKHYREEVWNTWNFDLANGLLTDDFRFLGLLQCGGRGPEASKDYTRLVQSGSP